MLRYSIFFRPQSRESRAMRPEWDDACFIGALTFHALRFLILGGLPDFRPEATLQLG